MKLLVLIAALITIQTSLHASPKFFMGVNGGSQIENDNVKQSFAYGGQVGLEWKYFGTSLNIYTFDTKSKGNELFKGDITLTPTMLTPYARIPIHANNGNEIVAFRLGGGAGYVKTSYSLDPSVITDASVGAPSGVSFNISENVKDSFGFQANGGIDYMITKNLILGADVNYLIFKPEVDRTIKITGPRLNFNSSFLTDASLNTLIVMATLKWRF